MILTREDLKELYADGAIEVVTTKLPTNAVQRVQPGVAKAAVCEVRAVDHWTHRNGGYVVVFELVKRYKAGQSRLRVVREQPRLMKRGHGTTRDPRAAMRDPDVPYDEDLAQAGAEPEMVDEETENRFARAGRKHSALRDVDRQRRQLTERLDRALEGAERLGVDPTRHLAAIERRISDLEKKSKKAA